jgi:glycosyltransferase involved in cell wall biosynthesis
MNNPVKDNTTLRVLQITQFLEIGGLETLVIEFSRQLKKKGVEVELLCLNEVDEKYAGILRKNNIPVHVIPEQSRLNFNFFRRGSTFIRRNQFEIVHAHSGCHLNAAIFARIAGVPKFIYTAHGMPMYTRLRDRLEDSLACSMTSHVISVSHEIEIFLKKWFWFPRCQFKTIINGVDTNKFKPLADRSQKLKLLEKYRLPAERILFGSVGRLATVKNYPMTLHALKRLVDAGVKNIGFVLVGEGSQEQHLAELADKLNISNYVYFLGMQYNIHEILPLFRFFVLSSLTEGTSISLLESQSCGIPAVVTDVGGNSVVVSHKENGYLCPLNDDEKMARFMKELINNNGLADEMGENARKRVKQYFSVETMTEQYLQIYREKA